MRKGDIENFCFDELTLGGNNTLCSLTRGWSGTDCLMLPTQRQKKIEFSVLLLENFPADCTSCTSLEMFPDSVSFRCNRGPGFQHVFWIRCCMFHFVGIILQVCRRKLANYSLLIILLGWAISGSMCIILICNDAHKIAQMGMCNCSSVAFTNDALEIPLHHLIKKTATQIPMKCLPHLLCKMLFYLPRDLSCPISFPLHYVSSFLGLGVDK